MKQVVAAWFYLAATLGLAGWSPAAEGSAALERMSSRFADHVLAAAGAIQESHVQEFERGELVAHALRGFYAKVRVKLPADLDDKLKKLNGAGDGELRAVLKDGRARLGARPELADDEDSTAAVRAMVTRIDPHGDVLPPFHGWHGPEITDIGARLEIDPGTKMLRIATPYYDSPAYRAGLRDGDVIARIVYKEDRFGEPLLPMRTIATRGMSVEEATQRLTGPVNTPIHLMLRDGDRETECVAILDRYRRESVFGVGRNRDDSVNHWLDRPGKLAYIRLERFTSETSKDLQLAISNLKKEGMKGLVLDLRFNPGGLIREAVSVADLFIDDGLICTIAPRQGRSEKYVGTRAGSELDFPMACLVNGESAHVTEVVAACLQDHRRAAIVGSRTRGNASIQNIQNLPWDATLKLSIALINRTNGKKLDRIRLPGRSEDEWGVTPDKGFLVELTDRERASLVERLRASEVIARGGNRAPSYPGDFKDRQLERAVEYLRAKVERR